MTRVYICGPMTGLPDFNRAAFRTSAEGLRKAGFDVISPLAISDEWGLGQTWRWYMREALHQLATADVVALLPGWERSRGASLEWQIAEGLGLLAMDAAALQKVNPQIAGEYFADYVNERAQALKGKLK